MSIFTYRVKDQKGKVIRGRVEARSDKDAANLLRENEFLVIEIKPAGTGLSLNSIFSSVNGLGFSEIVAFTRQLATMITAGLTLTEALSILHDQSTNKLLASVVDGVLHEIESGTSFASALSKYPRYFSNTYIASIRAGEAAGMLDQVLNRLADNLEKEKEFRAEIKGAMIYPIIVILGMGAVMFLMMTLVVPKMVGMYQDFGVDLPWTTRFIMVASNFFVNFWWLVIVGVIGLVLLFRSWVKTSVGAHLWDKFVFSLPILGNLRKEIILTEFCRTLGLLVGAGLPIIEALNIVSDSVDSITIKDKIVLASGRVEKGFPLGVFFSQEEIFPPILGQMTKVGEETGKMDESLLKLSRYFETESEQLVKGLTTAIEPIILVILGVGVGFLVWSIIIPMYELINSIQ